MTLLCGTDHFVRYCSKSKLDEHDQPATSAFYLRRREDGQPEEGLSVNWIEHFRPASVEQAVDQIRGSIQVNVTSNGRFALINVGDAKTTARQEYNRSLDVRHDPNCNDKSHCLVTGYTQIEDIELALVLREQTKQVLPGKVVD